MTWFGLSSSTSMIFLVQQSFIEGNGFSEKPGMNVVCDRRLASQSMLRCRLWGRFGKHTWSTRECQTCRMLQVGMVLKLRDNRTEQWILVGHTLYLGTLPSDLCTGFWLVPIGVKVWNMETGAHTEYQRSIVFHRERRVQKQGTHGSPLFSCLRIAWLSSLNNDRRTRVGLYPIVSASPTKVTRLIHLLPPSKSTHGDTCPTARCLLTWKIWSFPF